VGTITVDRLPSDAFKPKTDLMYEDVADLHPLFDEIAFGANLILVGPKGIAKTLSIAAWAGKHGYPIVTFDCSEDIRRAHLIGMFTLRGDESPFVLGPLTTSIEVANEVGHCILCLEEINALTPSVQKMLNSIGDFRRRIEVPECQRVFELKPGVKLWLCGTMNTSVYGGVYELNEDLKSRFRMLPVDYPTKGDETRILAKVVGNGVKKDTVTQVLTLAHETRQKSLAYSLSPRDTVQILEDVQRCGVEGALRLASGKFEGQDRDYFKERVKSTFGAVLK
jgi:MoxR-like ATPase